MFKMLADMFSVTYVQCARVSCFVSFRMLAAPFFVVMEVHLAHT